MKKVLALVLALTLAAGMSTVALAVDSHDATAVTQPTANMNTDGQFFPGETYHFTDLAVDATAITLNTANYSVSTKWTKGGAMIASVKIDNDKKSIAVKTNENYTLEDSKELIGTITLTAKKSIDGYEKGTKVNVVVGNGGLSWGVRNDAEDLDTYDNWDDAESTPKDDLNKNTIYTVDGSGKVVFASDTSLIQLKASVKDKQKFMIWMNEDTEYDAIDYLDDKNVEYDDLAFYNIKGKFSLSSGKGSVVINSDFSKKPYIYSWDGSKLAAVKNAKWNDEEGTYTAPVTGPTQFILSNKALVVEKEESSSEPAEEEDNTTTTNPDTGANDFVGLAVALAVVSVAGIAVAKKH